MLEKADVFRATQISSNFASNFKSLRIASYKEFHLVTVGVKKFPLPRMVAINSALLGLLHLLHISWHLFIVYEM